MITPTQTTAAHPAASDRSQELRAAAEMMETQFLSEMLSHSGLGAREGTFGGGVGEEQFASLLATEHAKALVGAGGIGLAERIFQSLEGRYGR